MRTPLACLIAALAAAVVPSLPARAAAAPAEVDPFEPADPFVRANAALARGDFAAAEALAAPLATGASPRADACTLLGEVRLGQKRTTEAIEFFEKAARLDPDSATCQSRLGTAILQSVGGAEPAQRGALVARALAVLRRALELEPDHVDACIALAHFYAEAPPEAGGNPELAAAYAERARKSDVYDGRIEGTLVLATMAERQGRFETALVEYRKAAGIWSSSPELCACEVRVLSRLGRMAEARACLERLVERFPDWEPGRQALAAMPAAPAPAPAAK